MRLTEKDKKLIQKKQEKLGGNSEYVFSGIVRKMLIEESFYNVKYLSCCRY